MKKPKEIDFGFRIDHKKLWKLNLLVEEMPIKSLSFNFDIPYLEKEGTDDWNLSINGLLANLDMEVTHKNKMLKADLRYPIDIYNFSNNWIVLDGVHRLAKAIYLGQQTIKVRKLSDSDLDLIKK